MNWFEYHRLSLCLNLIRLWINNSHFEIVGQILKITIFKEKRGKLILKKGCGVFFFTQVHLEMSYSTPYFISSGNCLIWLRQSSAHVQYFVGFTKFPVILTGLFLYWFYRQFAENNYHIVRGDWMTYAGVLHTTATLIF